MLFHDGMLAFFWLLGFLAGGLAPIEFVAFGAVLGMVFLAPRGVALFLFGYLWFLGVSPLPQGGILLQCEGSSFVDVFGFPFGTRCWLPGWRLSFQDFVVSKVSNFPGTFQEWIYCVLLGDRLQSAQTRDNFKVLGIYHLLIISGLHFVILLRFLSSVIIFPVRFCYALALISPPSYLGTRIAAKVVTGAISIGFGCLVGWPAPVQRAFLTGAINFLVIDFLASVSLGYRIILGIFLQTVLFPYSFMSSSNILSWLAYIELASFNRRRSIGHLLLGQLRLALLVGGCLGYVSLVGVLVNLVLVPLFPVILIGSFAALFVPDGWGHIIALSISQGFSLLDELGRRCSEYPFTGFDIGDHRLLRVLLVVGLVVGALLQEVPKD